MMKSIKIELRVSEHSERIQHTVVLSLNFLSIYIYTVGRQLSELQLSEHASQPNATRSHTHHNLIIIFFFFAVLMITLEFAS